MILVDTSVWIDHFRRGDRRLAGLLEQGRVVMHSFIVGEIACGDLAKRSQTLELLQDLPSARVAHDDEVLGFIARHALHGKGLGYVDMHLLASVALSPGTTLWTRDKRLMAVAEALAGSASGSGSGAH